MLDLKKRPLLVASSLAAAAALVLFACVTPPPRIAAIPASGLAVRVHVFGAEAEDALRTFQLVNQNNQSFSIVSAGGDGEILVGLEKDTGACVEPTALCTYRISYRIKNAKGDVLRTDTELVSATSDHCTVICDQAISNAVTKVVEHAALVLKGDGDPSPLASSSASPSASAAASAAPDADAGATSDAGAKDLKEKPSKKYLTPAPAPAPAGKEPILCAVGSGPRLPSDEAEKRVGQVEALKRMGVLDQQEFDCLRKAFLARL